MLVTVAVGPREPYLLVDVQGVGRDSFVILDPSRLDVTMCVLLDHLADAWDLSLRRRARV